MRFISLIMLLFLLVGCSKPAETNSESNAQKKNVELTTEQFIEETKLSDKLSGGTDSSSCLELKDQNLQDLCIVSTTINQAKKSKDKSICSKITDVMTRETCELEAG